MPYLIALLGLIGGLGFWYYRFMLAKDAASELLNMADDVRLAARRFGFKRRNNQNPIDAIEDPRLSAVGLLVVIAEEDGAMSQQELEAIQFQARKVFKCSAEEAAELLAFGRWIANLSPNRSETARRLARRTVGIGGNSIIDDLNAMIRAVATTDGREPGGEALQAIDRLKQLRG